MDITDSNFRDRALAEVTIGYDWVESRNYALIRIVENDSTIVSYRISGLTEYAIYDDFSAMVIDQCKFVVDSNGLYLSLDPYDEAAPMNDKDNFYFIGKTIERVEE